MELVEFRGKHPDEGDRSLLALSELQRGSARSRRADGEVGSKWKTQRHLPNRVGEATSLADNRDVNFQESSTCHS
jgi:hypothetical protein